MSQMNEELIKHPDSMETEIAPSSVSVAVLVTNWKHVDVRSCTQLSKRVDVELTYFSYKPKNLVTSHLNTAHSIFYKNQSLENTGTIMQFQLPNIDLSDSF